MDLFYRDTHCIDHQTPGQWIMDSPFNNGSHVQLWLNVLEWESELCLKGQGFILNVLYFYILCNRRSYPLKGQDSVVEACLLPKKF